ncbi:hypothetical protein ElyMa_004448300 [Elysia marginata]|uniref:Uncharacterized protein n=1 Tax=Elysia marginata TaxID=1093978 RepID=A0AAV4HEA6_9GAST|nr:hypothetical protein ElyMa_004448300 [Elysia marginata]
MSVDRGVGEKGAAKRNKGTEKLHLYPGSRTVSSVRKAVWNVLTGRSLASQDKERRRIKILSPTFARSKNIHTTAMHEKKKKKKKKKNKNKNKNKKNNNKKNKNKNKKKKKNKNKKNKNKNKKKKTKNKKK